MAFVLSDLQEGIKSVRIYIGNQPINLKIKPSAVTQAKADAYREAQQDGDYDQMAAIFREFVVEWDIVLTEGSDPVPMDADMYETVPTMVTEMIWDEIGKLVRPKSRKKNER